MSFAILLSRAQVGLQAPLVRIEANLSGGLPQFSIVGLAEKTVRESRDRVRAAIRNAGFDFPQGRITVNLAPADIPKNGGRFDLPIALGVLAASKQIPSPSSTWEEYEFYGELALSGELRQFRGALPVALAAQAQGRQLIVPLGNLREVLVASGSRVAAAADLAAVVAHIRGVSLLPVQIPPKQERDDIHYPDLSDVRGQPLARRALEIAAAGGHSLLMVGPPGTGKSMLAARLPGILPPLTDAEGLETAAVYSLSGTGFDRHQWLRRPFRAPHHTASAPALVGGGSDPRPGEVSLAHNGVLFLDELPEFRRDVLEVLRQPIETGEITISRATRQARFPCRFQLIAAMNPCPCGYHGDPQVNCYCGQPGIHRYRRRISGPLLDRIDLQIEVTRIDRKLLRPAQTGGEASAAVAARVSVARQLQHTRCGFSNASMRNADVSDHCVPSPAAQELLEEAMNRLAMSARAYTRILRVARTIADLEGANNIDAQHLGEAITLRSLLRPDREHGAANSKPR